MEELREFQPATVIDCHEPLNQLQQPLIFEHFL